MSRHDARIVWALGSHVECSFCGKRGYSSEQQARRSMGRCGNRVRVYRCEAGFWHVTSQSHAEAKWWQ